jgi:hypothetical protein
MKSQNGGVRSTNIFKEGGGIPLDLRFQLGSEHTFPAIVSNLNFIYDTLL